MFKRQPRVILLMFLFSAISFYQTFIFSTVLVRAIDWAFLVLILCSYYFAASSSLFGVLTFPHRHDYKIFACLTFSRNSDSIDVANHL